MRLASPQNRVLKLFLTVMAAVGTEDGAQAKERWPRGIPLLEGRLFWKRVGHCAKVAKLQGFASGVCIGADK